jgi:hypothetical protein
MFEIPFDSARSPGFPSDNTFAGPGIPLPYVYYRYGTGDGTMEANNYSYYVNDLWTINNNHSVMAGVRLDKFFAANSIRDLASYMMPTFRFEYKWDIHGDQKRLMNVSWGQFHTFQGMGPFGIMTPTDGNIREIRYWTEGSAKPHLVDDTKLFDLDNYGYSTAKAEAGSTYTIDPDWRSTVSTEFAVGMTRNLSIGGFWKASFIYRTWANDWNYYPGEIITDTTGTKTFQKVLKNATGYERKYTGVELEWEIPIHKRITLLGSYTYNRFMHNTPGSVDQPAYWIIEGNNPVDWSEYLDRVVPGGRQGYNPVRLRQPEHYLKAFLLFDISSGRVKSSLTLNGQFTSASPNHLYDYYIFNYPDKYPELTSVTGVTVPGTTGTQSMPYYTSRTNILGMSNNDSWSVFFRYLITVPIYKKLSWMATIHIDNPFNHRGFADLFSSGSRWDYDVYSPDFAVWAGSAGVDELNGVWRSPDDFRGAYRSRQGGRQIYFNTGIRF